MTLEQQSDADFKLLMNWAFQLRSVIPAARTTDQHIAMRFSPDDAQKLVETIMRVLGVSIQEGGAS